MTAARGLAGLLALAVLATGCSVGGDDESDPPQSAPGSSATGATSGTLDWKPCDGSFQCASLEVPLDYDDPEGEQSRDPPCGGHLGGIRIPPSTRTVSPFMYELRMHSSTMLASSSGTPSRLGNSTLSPSLALNVSACSPSP